jgi:hypothetical protein
MKQRQKRKCGTSSPAFAPLMRRASALWDPTHHRWCIVPNRIGPALDQLERFQRVDVRLD